MYLVELEADTKTRIERNKTEHRLLHKPTKRNIEWSEAMLIQTDKEARMNSLAGEINSEDYVRINNTAIGPDEVARMIKDRFSL